MKVTATDLRFHSKEILESTMHGKEVIITVHGIPKAKIIPYKHDKDESFKHQIREEGNAFGMWKDKEDLDDVIGFIRDLRKI